MRRIGFILLAAVLSSSVPSHGQEPQPLGDIARQVKAQKKESTTEAGVKANLNADASTDIGALDEYSAAVRELLYQEKFDKLDQIADDARSNKARFSGGVWKLLVFYRALGMPDSRDGVSQADWTNHLQKLEEWKSANPQSITARVALAEFHLSYGIEARGKGYASTVSEQGWKGLEEQVGRARAELQEASLLRTKCPQWYLEMQDVARLSGWDLARATATFDQAVAFEPLYYSYYRTHAMYLLPKWYGNQGDASRFAEEASARVGGAEGDVVYFEIAAEFDYQRDPYGLLRMSWPRIKQGYTAMQEKYGVSLVKMNQVAHIAGRVGDYEFEHQMLQRIGERWDPKTWKTKGSFESEKVTTARMAHEIALQSPGAAPSEIEANMKASGGREYGEQVAKTLDTMLAVSIKPCSQVTGTKVGSFDLLLLLAIDGRVENFVALPTTPVSTCLTPRILGTRFPAPPKSNYWVKIGVGKTP